MTTRVSELRLSAEDRHIAEAAAQAIRRHAPDAEVILFGSRAAGSAGAESDFDFLVIVDTPDRFGLAMELTEVLEQVQCLPSFDLIVVPRQDWDATRQRYGFIAREADRHGIRIHA